jgi:pyruvate,water dikinase
MTDLLPLDAISPGDGDAVGGKGLGLGRMAAAGLPVPPGFCVTSAAHRRLRGRTTHDDSALAQQIADACGRLGGGPVAVRSSATAEDGAEVSFAGQQDTFLGVRGGRAVCDAVGRCWASLDGERAVAYRRRQGVGGEGLAMAVVVQRLVPAEVAGVLFTRDPLDPDGRGMLVEASWGLGEAVVAGRVNPDRYRLDRDTGAVRDRSVGLKTLEVTPEGERPVPPERQSQPCLDDNQLSQLAELGRRVEALFGGPRDVEWAWAGGQCWLLQARPITAAGAAEREQVRREEIAALAARAEPGGTVWSRFNLSEVLPEPTPMTWSVVRRFLSGRGGYGLMYRDLGFRPDPSLDEEGVYDLVAGRPYCNLSREPRLYSGPTRYEHPFAALKADPRRALEPRAVPGHSRAGPAAWLLLPFRLPFVFFGSLRHALRLGTASRTFADRFRREVVPAFAEETARAAAEDLTRLDEAALLARLEHWVRRTLYDFARDSLKPTALAALALANLERGLTPCLGADRARAALRELSMGIRPDPEADLAAAFRDVAEGRLGREAFLKRFGHRGSGEMELTQPRWGEDPAALDDVTLVVERSPDRSTAPTVGLPRPGDLRSQPGAGSGDPAPTWGAAGSSESPPESGENVWKKVAAEARLSGVQVRLLETECRAARTYLALRETAKHQLMRGYAEVRRTLVELDRRRRLDGGIFFLTLEELPRLTAGEDLSGVIAQRKRRRAVALSLEAPPVLFSDDLEALGRPVAVEGADTLQGVPLSAGVAEGPALVLDRPRTDGLPAGPYVLVCPSTDPAWVPLFVRARGLVMETGGVLSHGAIVAREFGLPAVAGLPGVQRRLRTGQRLRVDGARGTVTVLPVPGEPGG